MNLRWFRCLAFVCAGLTLSQPVWAAKLPTQKPNRSRYQVQSAVESPFVTNRTHKVGNIAFTVTNWGFIGSAGRGEIDPCTRRPAESFEFPRGSGVEYLFQGALWVGAIVNRDTLVSVGADGWLDNNEMFPDPFPEGDIIERTNRPLLRQPANSACPDAIFTKDAVSEQDFVATYYDTVTNSQFVGSDGNDGRPHIPIGIQVRQESYSWSFDYAKDFILLDFKIIGLSSRTIDDLYMGLYMDHDVGHVSNGEAYDDDITGFTPTVEAAVGEGYRDTVNIAWISDNDGDPNSSNRFGFNSVTGVSGVRVVRAPADLKFSFNWWISNGTASQDWGPNKANTKVTYPAGNLGTPEGDVNKYLTLSNGEFDFAQVDAANTHVVDGWLPPLSPLSNAIDIADGFDTRYLLSFGPFDVNPGDTLPLTVAIVAGADFHDDPRNFQVNFTPANPQLFLDGLNFTNFARNAQWAGWVYDTPGFDSDSNGTKGSYRIVNDDTAYYTGDGVPDFQGPPPPAVPDVRFITVERQVILRWNGLRAETERDVFSNLADFEGYRVYMSRTGQLADFSLLAQRDNINYIRWRFNADAFRWIVEDPPFTLDSLQFLYNDLVDSVYDFTPFHPDSFKVADVTEAMREIVLDPVDQENLDTNYYYFTAFDSNQKADDSGLAFLNDSLGHPVYQVIRKRFPQATPADTMYENGEPFNMFYEYEFAIDGLQLAEPVFLAVTTFDFGNPQAELSSLESSPLATMQEIWPLNSAEVVKSTRPKPGVFPNPYRLSEDYNSAGWEDPGRIGSDPERARKVTFTNVPDTCVVSVWTLDGDLVRRLDHYENPSSSQATVVEWDLITRNTQAVKTGLYIYTVESRFGTDIGKLVIIK